MALHILVTNDDGIHAPGLRALAKALSEIGTVTVVAPSQERSATAQSLTLRQPIYCEQLAEREFAVEGTPADAMILAFNTLLKEKPDIVVSGINPGGNLGENVYYSGTIGAAMEGAINRTPSLAVSVAFRGKNFDFAPIRPVHPRHVRDRLNQPLDGRPTDASLPSAAEIPTRNLHESCRASSAPSKIRLHDFA